MTKPLAPTNVEVVLYTLAVLGGDEKSIHLESISVKAFALSPGAFRWDLDELAEMIDKDKVRVSLTDAQKDKYGGLVRAVGPKRPGVSKPTDVWRLTPAGVEWFLENRERLSRSLGDTQQPALKKGRAKRVRDRIIASDLYQVFRDNGEIEYQPFAFADLIESSPDANADLMQKRYDELLSQVVLLKDVDLRQFLEQVGQAHADMLVQQREVRS